MERMSEYKLAAEKAFLDGKIPERLYRKLTRCQSPRDFYICLEANGYMGDVWDAVEGKDKYPWTQ
jgi:hypothetical protein